MSWQRIDNFRNKTGKNLDQVAEAIGVGKSMLMMVKSGQRHLSTRALYRLEQAERAAGIAPPGNVTKCHSDDSTVLVRVADALERIATALEKLASRD